MYMHLEFKQKQHDNKGGEMDEKIKDLPDHVAVETEFMYYLIFNEVTQLEKSRRKKALTFWENQKTFFDRHYKNWVVMFCKKISKETNNDYYRATAECLSRFIQTVEIPDFPEARK